MDLRTTSIYSLLLLTFLAVNVQGQENLNWNALAPDNNMLVGNNLEFEGKKVGVDGSPLLFDTWLKGYVILKGKSQMKDVKINLKNQEGELFVSVDYKGLDTYYNIDESKVLYFVVEDSITGANRKFELLNSKETKGVSKGIRFYEVLFDNSSKLVKLGMKDFFQAEQDKAYAIKDQKSRFVLEEAYFFKSNNGDRYQRLKLKKKDLLKVLGGAADQAKTLMKKNKWSWSKEADVIKLLESLAP